MLHPSPDLLAAILADPDDDAPRLASADWFDEQGFPERARLIRVQCALGGWPRPSVAAWRELAAEAEAILTSHRAAWEGVTGGVGREAQLTWRRGYPFHADAAGHRNDWPTLAQLPTLEIAELSKSDLRLGTLDALRPLAALRALSIRSADARRADELLDALVSLLPRLWDLQIKRWPNDGWRARFAERRRAAARAATGPAAQAVERAGEAYAARHARPVRAWETSADAGWLPAHADTPGPHMLRHSGALTADTLAGHRASIVHLAIDLAGTPDPGAFHGLENVRELCVFGREGVVGWPDIARRTPALESLELYTLAVAPDDLAEALRRCPGLRTVRVWYTEADSCLWDVLAGAPGLREVAVSETVGRDRLAEIVAASPPRRALVAQSDEPNGLWVGVPAGWGAAGGVSRHRVGPDLPAGAPLPPDGRLAVEGFGEVAIPAFLLPTPADAGDSLAAWAFREEGFPDDAFARRHAGARLRLSLHAVEAGTEAQAWLDERTPAPEPGRWGRFGGSGVYEATQLTFRGAWVRGDRLLRLEATCGNHRHYPWRERLAERARQPFGV